MCYMLYVYNLFTDTDIVDRGLKTPDIYLHGTRFIIASSWVSIKPQFQKRSPKIMMCV